MLVLDTFLATCLQLRIYPRLLSHHRHLQPVLHRLSHLLLTSFLHLKCCGRMLHNIRHLFIQLGLPPLKFLHILPQLAHLQILHLLPLILTELHNSPDNNTKEKQKSSQSTHRNNNQRNKHERILDLRCSILPRSSIAILRGIEIHSS